MKGTGKKERSVGIVSRYFTCPGCGAQVRIPTGWICGVERVFRCSGCRRNFWTGYKMGAFLMGLSLTLSLVTVNLFLWVFGSVMLPLAALMIVPLWLFFGFLLRRYYLYHKCGIR